MYWFYNDFSVFYIQYLVEKIIWFSTLGVVSAVAN